MADLPDPARIAAVPTVHDEITDEITELAPVNAWVGDPLGPDGARRAAALYTAYRMCLGDEDVTTYDVIDFAQFLLTGDNHR